MWCLRPWVLPFVLALTGLLVVYIAWGSMYTPEALWAPGHLSRHHADLLECHLCHQAFQGTTNDKCLSCHSTKKFQVKSEVAVTEFHQAIITPQAILLGLSHRTPWSFSKYYDWNDAESTWRDHFSSHWHIILLRLSPNGYGKGNGATNTTAGTQPRVISLRRERAHTNQGILPSVYSVTLEDNEK